ncbi:MAG: mannose-1-phosphate guanylyltransferase [Bacteroidota bacterium]|nr:mannose-1-phosphate guanylyltransferase [Bacteroidota bacterium]
MNTNYYAIIMAGGVGMRFWPMSTSEFPKQFHDVLGDGKSLLQRTFDRLTKIVPSQNIYVFTNSKYNDLVLNQLNIDKEQVVLEPSMQNTAPCILYASMKIQKQNPEAQIIVAPSDHWIEDEASFVEHIQKSFDFCKQNEALVTLGIKPTYPNTGYGYIEYNKDTTEGIKKVSQFREKPNLKTAEEFLQAGNFLWNAGIFVWNVSSILEAFKKYVPSMFALFNQAKELYNTADEVGFINQNYQKAENISIDYAVLEKADNIYVLPSNFDWSDLGTWGALYDKLPKDYNQNTIINAQVIAEESTQNIIRTQKNKLVVIRGLDNYIVVETPDALLIYPKTEEQAIKNIVQNNNL